jgi:hypothetical protein
MLKTIKSLSLWVLGLFDILMLLCLWGPGVDFAEVGPIGVWDRPLSLQAGLPDRGSRRHNKSSRQSQRRSLPKKGHGEPQRRGPLQPAKNIFEALGLFPLFRFLS